MSTEAEERGVQRNAAAKKKKKKMKMEKKEKRKTDKELNGHAPKLTKVDRLTEAGGRKKQNKSRKKVRADGERVDARVSQDDRLRSGADDNDDGAADHNLLEAQVDIGNFKEQNDTTMKAEIRIRKSKKLKKKKERATLKEDQNISENAGEDHQDDVHYISSGDEDTSKGMKKWLTEHQQSRPGLKVLQQRIDDFITAHEEKLEQERKEREARVAEDGWTVVVHHKGRKKTTDSETGVTVGSVAPAVVEDQMAKKKPKGVGPNFYRFQKREAQRNEILMLQSKFEQDRKRIQQLRAARKFKPY